MQQSWTRAQISKCAYLAGADLFWDVCTRLRSFCLWRPGEDFIGSYSILIAFTLIIQFIWARLYSHSVFTKTLRISAPYLLSSTETGKNTLNIKHVFVSIHLSTRIVTLLKWTYHQNNFKDDIIIHIFCKSKSWFILFFLHLFLIVIPPLTLPGRQTVKLDKIMRKYCFQSSYFTFLMTFWNEIHVF